MAEPAEDQEPAETAPWAMQLAVRIERSSAPTIEDVCAGAAAAVLALLRDPRAVEPEGPWTERVRRWRHGRIRKIVRRTRGAAWVRAQSVDGVTVMAGPIEVRAYVPSPTDLVPEEIARLQIDSTATPLEHGEAPAPGAPGLWLAITPKVAMSWGKQAAQAAHAAQIAYERADPGTRAAWRDAGEPIHVAFPADADWDATGARPQMIEIRDGGFTEIPAGTLTARAWFSVEADRRGASAQLG